MRISRQDKDTGQVEALRGELTDVIASPCVSGRVCSEDCLLTCNTCGSVSCQCMCHIECPHAPNRLSSNPDRFPVEPKVVPLVFAMKREGTCISCWSCEGHEGPDGTLWKVPRVWFYCASVVYLRLIGEGLRSLHTDRKLQARWHVAVTHSDPDNADTTFSIEPDLNLCADVSLHGLQADIPVIAEAWEGMLKSAAAGLRQSIA